MTEEEAIRQVRRAAGRLGRIEKGLEQLQWILALFLADALPEIAAGRLPLTAEARLVVALQNALCSLDGAESELRYAASRRRRRRLEGERKTDRRQA
jgi:hypothetical protein